MRAVRTQSQGLSHVQSAEQQADLPLTERGPTRPPVGARVATRMAAVRVIKHSDLPRPATLAASGTRWLIVLDSSLGDREALYFKLRELKHLLDSTEPHISGSESASPPVRRQRAHAPCLGRA